MADPVDFSARDATDDEGTKGLEAVFEVPVLPGALLAILWEPANFPKLFPDVKEYRIVAGEVGAARIDIAYRVDAVIREVRYVLRRTLDREARTITWQELSGDLRRVRGGWRLEPSARPGASRVTYRAFIDIGKFVPTGLVRESAKRKLGEMVTRLRSVALELVPPPG